ncbi:hypothetical protein [Anaerocellum danielii]|uniref:DUF4830 domain-containing protein n=1 Tax=Anaerocellum danielii TaxID=1387557 RepID=A0ABZ0U2H8_9FIRM|nr:hypothetical protein [Caldicellulosiruptor danielii]WPX08430.1 hypothetical protein SOJ16_002313 [Caldicellulosiruptor danielii]
MRYWKLIIGIITPLIFTIWLIPTAVSASFVIDHNDEVNKLRRQFAAEGMLRAFLTGPMEKDESYKKDIATVIGFPGPYDIEKFKLSEEYLYVEPFKFPVINKKRNNWTDYIYISSELKEKVKNLKFESWNDTLKTEFVEKGWARIIFYDNKPVGYMLIKFYEDTGDYKIFEFSPVSPALGEAVENMKKFLTDKGLNSKVKIFYPGFWRGESLYVVSDDGNWWAVGVKGFEDKIRAFNAIKDALNKRPKEILDDVEKFGKLLKEAPEKIKIGGPSYPPLYEVIKNEEERRKNVLIAVFLLIGTGALVIGISLSKKDKFKQLSSNLRS